MPLPCHIDIPLTDDQAVSLQLIRIPAGDFLMGSRGRMSWEEPVHEVRIPFDFYLGKFPVTQQQFAVWANATDLDHKNHFFYHKNHFPYNDHNPAERMSWDDSVRFCIWLSDLYEHNQLADQDWPSGYRCALPSEAQWEYACSAWSESTHDNGSVRMYTEYHTGDGEGALQQAGWYDSNSDSRTHVVGGKAGNRHGLYDMHGNVDEWCADSWSDEAYTYRAGTVEDPLVLHDDVYRVLRGGSWRNRPTYCRSAYRSKYRRDNRYWYVGFRVGLFPVQSCQNQQD